MKKYEIEHIGIIVEKPIEMAHWSQEALGFNLKFSAQDEEKGVAFLTDWSDKVMLEFGKIPNVLPLTVLGREPQSPRDDGHDRGSKEFLGRGGVGKSEDHIKISEFPRIGMEFRFNLRDLRAAGTMLTPRHHLLHLGFGALDQQFNPAIPEISDPSGHTEALRCSDCTITEGHSLNISRYVDLRANIRHCSPMKPCQSLSALQENDQRACCSSELSWTR